MNGPDATSLLSMRGFVSYSHLDRKHCTDLLKPLKALQRIFEIEEFWTDDCTPTGRCFRKGYEDAIEKACIHVLLISSNSLWSDEIMNRELPLINDKNLSRGDLVLPVVLDNCQWDSVVGSLLASPRDENLDLKPVLHWRPIREGFNRVGEQFSNAIARHFRIEPRRLFKWR